MHKNIIFTVGKIIDIYTCDKYHEGCKKTFVTSIKTYRIPYWILLFQNYSYVPRFSEWDEIQPNWRSYGEKNVLPHPANQMRWFNVFHGCRYQMYPSVKDEAEKSRKKKEKKEENMRVWNGEWAWPGCRLLAILYAPPLLIAQPHPGRLEAGRSWQAQSAAALHDSWKKCESHHKPA